jgi:hypothetical protein
MGNSDGVAGWLAVVIALLQWLVSCLKDRDVQVVNNQTKTPTVIERAVKTLTVRRCCRPRVKVGNGVAARQLHTTTIPTDTS